MVNLRFSLFCSFIIICATLAQSQNERTVMTEIDADMDQFLNSKFLANQYRYFSTNKHFFQGPLTHVGTVPGNKAVVPNNIKRAPGNIATIAQMGLNPGASKVALEVVEYRTQGIQSGPMPQDDTNIVVFSFDSDPESGFTNWLDRSFSGFIVILTTQPDADGNIWRKTINFGPENYRSKDWSATIPVAKNLTPK